MINKKVKKGMFLSPFIWGLLLLVFIPLNSVAQEENLISQAQRLVEEKDFKQAIEILNRFIETNRGDTEKKKDLCEAHYLLAKIHFILNEYSIMEKNIQEIFFLDPFFYKDDENREFFDAVSYNWEILDKEAKKRERRKIREEIEAAKPQKPPVDKSNWEKMVLFAGGAYASGMTVGGASYSRSDTANFYVDVYDSGSLSASVPANTGGTIGLMRIFNNLFGVMVSSGYIPPTPVDIKSSYTLKWTFDTTDNENSYDASTEWKNTGDIKVMPLNLNGVLLLHIGNNTLLNINAGFSIFFTNVRLYTEIGYGEGWSAIIDDVKWKFEGSSTYDVAGKRAAWADYFALPLKIEKNETLFGFNAGIDLEQKISKNIGVFIGVYYGMSGKKTYLWELEAHSAYAGQFNHFDTNTTGMPSYAGTMSAEVGYSHLQALIGIKLHFK